MAVATTAIYDELVLEISEDDILWTRICGVMDFSISRGVSTDEDEIPDCNDESLPHTVIVNTRAYKLQVSGTGKWAAESHDVMLNWIKSGAKKSARVGYVNAPSGTPQYESGPAVLSQLDHERRKGIAVSAAIQISWAGETTLTDAA